jgi:hypothetical protein
MKRVLVILLAATLFSTAYAYEWRILGGLSIARSTEPLEDYGRMDWSPYVKANLAGGVGGAGVLFSLAPHLDLEIDGLFLQKGADVEIIGIAGPFLRYHDRVNELSVPVLLKLSLLHGTSPYVLAGGEAAWVISRAPKDVDYGFVFGAGVDIPLGKTVISLEGRYHLGLRDLTTDSSVLRKMRAALVLIGLSW